MLSNARCAFNRAQSSSSRHGFNCRGASPLSRLHRSLVYTFDNAEEPSRHTLQYFTTKGNRAIYKDGWWAGNRYMYMWEPGFNNPNATDKDIDVRPWELYNLNEDFTQAYNLADKYPEKLKELLQVFYSEAKRNKAYPILPKMSGNPNFSIAGQKVFTFHSGVKYLPLSRAPNLSRGAYTITANVDVPASNAEGVIIAQGGLLGGVSLFVKNGRVHFEMNLSNKNVGQLVSNKFLRAGKSQIKLTFTPQSATKPELQIDGQSGTAVSGRPDGSSEVDVRLLINGEPSGQTHFSIENGGRIRETLDIGCDLGSSVSPEYKSPYRYTGKIDTVKIEMK